MATTTVSAKGQRHCVVYGMIAKYAVHHVEHWQLTHIPQPVGRHTA